MDAADQATFEALWKQVLADFDGEAHGKLVQHAQRAGLLLEAAKRYRLYKKQLDEDDHLDADEKKTRIETIDKRLGGIAMLAMAQLDATKTEATPSKGARLFTVIVAAMMVAAILGLIAALRL